MSICYVLTETSVYNCCSIVKSISSPVPTEEYRVLVDYEQHFDKDLPLVAGDTVHVVKKRDDGEY